MSRDINTSTEFDNTSGECDAALTPKELISKEWYKDPPQRYTGELLYNNLHGHGFYFIGTKDKIFYDGLFYANKLEGYSQVFYCDGSNFQGLFKENKRFGPGIFTYPDNKQDVGLWSGYTLASLAVDVEPNVIPKLAHSMAGKLKLLKYRYLVPVCPVKEDFANDMLKSLGANENILNDSYKLYNLGVDNRNNLFFNKSVFDEQFYHKPDCSIDIILTDEEIEEQNNVINEEEAEEEKSCDISYDLKRIQQINEELKIVKTKLEEIKVIKNNIQVRVEYCRNCCYMGGIEENYENEDDVTNVAQEDDVTHVSQQELDISRRGKQGSIGTKEEDDDTRSYMTIDYDRDIQYTTTPTEFGDEYVASAIKEYFKDRCTCDEEMQIDDLNILEQQLEEVTKDELFYETIYKNLQDKLDAHKIKTEENNSTDVKTKKVVVNDLLAWNNEELSMSMLKHSFLHRKTEYMVTFNVSNILFGNRYEFEEAGAHERNCIDFLIECCKGEVRNLLENIRKHNINVNVCDARGNSAVFFAVANCRSHIVSTLVNFGAKLDQVNGEGLTPLTLSFLSYLALKNDVMSWEKCFLPDTNLPPQEEREVRKWYPNRSLLTLSSRSDSISLVEAIKNLPDSKDKFDKKGKTPLKPGINLEENYLFSTAYPIYVEPKKKAGDKSNKKVHMVEADSEPEKRKEEDENKHLLEKTIGVLLDCGANPNFGEVPLPPLLLSVFAKNADLVRRLLEADADPNITTDEQLTGLHVIASLKFCQENVDIAEVLLEYYCDPNLKCSPCHWHEQKIKILGKNVKPGDYEDYGKNPLHLLCLRRDFPLDNCQYFEQLAGLFLENNIYINDKYLGHTPLSLAVLVGNMTLAERLLNESNVDPYLPLGYNMGNILTLYILKRYEDVLPLEKSKQMLKFLVDSSVNPLRTVGECENAIGFMEKEHEIIKVVEKGKKNKGKDKKSNKGSKGSKKESKKGTKKGAKKGKGNNQNVLKEYLKELTRDIIIKYIQMEAVENLYNLVEENMLDYDQVKVMAEFLTPSVALENLKILFNHTRIKAGRFDKNICLQLIEFVDKYKRVVKAKKGKKEKGSPTSNKSKKGLQNTQEPVINYSNILDAPDFIKMYKTRRAKLVKPGLDNTTKYHVCFHCLRKHNKLLIICPRCQYVYFCSEQCNKLNMKMKAQHFCNINFYKTEKARCESEDVVTQANLQELCERALENCGERLRKKEEDEREMERKKLEEEKKLDIYGTKFLKEKHPTISSKFLISRKRRDTEVTLFGSVASTDGLNVNRRSTLNRKLNKLSIFEEKYTSMLLQRHASSLKQLDTSLYTSEIASYTEKKTAKKSDFCECEEMKKLESEMANTIKPQNATKKNGEKRKIYKEEVVSKFESIEVMAEPKPVVRKLRKMPIKYQYFMELLSTYFPNEDLSFLCLPYACYSNGHLYYKFLNDDIFSRTYSMM